MCNIPTIPMMFAATNSSRNQHFFVSLSSCKTSVSLWISAMLDNLAMDPPAISCHEDQFPHAVKQITTTRKWHFFHLPNATIGYQCLGFHTLRTWPKSFPQLRWVQDFWFTHDKIWNHHVKSWQTCFFWRLHVKNPEVMWKQRSAKLKTFDPRKQEPVSLLGLGWDLNMSSTMIIHFWLPKYNPRLCQCFEVWRFCNPPISEKPQETQPVLRCSCLLIDIYPNVFSNSWTCCGNWYYCCHHYCCCCCYCYWLLLLPLLLLLLPLLLLTLLVLLLFLPLPLHYH